MVSRRRSILKHRDEELGSRMDLRRGVGGKEDIARADRSSERLQERLIGNEVRPLDRDAIRCLRRKLAGFGSHPRTAIASVQNTELDDHRLFNCFRESYDFRGGERGQFRNVCVRRERR